MHWDEASLSEERDERVEPPVERDDRDEPTELAGLVEDMCLKSSMVAVENWLLSSSTGDMA